MSKSIASVLVAIAMASTSTVASAQHIYSTSPTVVLEGIGHLGALECDVLELTVTLAEGHAPGHTSGGVNGYNTITNIVGNNFASTNAACHGILITGGSGAVSSTGEITINNLSLNVCPVPAGPFPAEVANVDPSQISVFVNATTVCGSLTFDGVSVSPSQVQIAL